MESRTHASHYRDHHHHHSFTQRGNSTHGSSSHSAPKRNYKLLVDPMIVKGANKLCRFEGIVENDPTYPTVVLRDPRKLKIWIKPEIIDLPVPRFKIDANYVGPPPPLEVTMININDNIHKDFLHKEIVNKYQAGPIEELHIYTHELSRKHLGIARIVFEDAEAARTCVNKMNNVSLMGKVLRVFFDPFGKECSERVEALVEKLEDESRKEEELKKARMRPAPPPPPLKPPSPAEPVETSPKAPPIEDPTEKYNNARLPEERKAPSPPPPQQQPLPPFYGDQPPPFSSSGHGMPSRGQSFHPRYEQRFMHPRAPQPLPNHPTHAPHPRPSHGPGPNPHSPLIHPLHPHRAPVHPLQQNHHQSPYKSFSPFQEEFRPRFANVIPPRNSWKETPPLGDPQVWRRSPKASQQEYLPQHPWEDRYRELESKSSQRNTPMHMLSQYDRRKSDGEEISSEEEEEQHTSNLATATGTPEQENCTHNESKPSLDLETRIAMLLQSKDSSIAPPFLSLAEGSDEEGRTKACESEIKADLADTQTRTSSGSHTGSEDGGEGSLKDGSKSPSQNAPLSTPPSPFLSEEQYLLWHSKSLELQKEAQRVEKEENKERLRKLRKRRLKRSPSQISTKENDKDQPDDKGPSLRLNGNDDSMSLSSLSSTEDPILHRDVPIPPLLPVPTMPTAFRPNFPQSHPHSFNQGFSQIPPGSSGYHWGGPRHPVQNYHSNMPSSYSHYNASYGAYPPAGAPSDFNAPRPLFSQGFPPGSNYTSCPYNPVEQQAVLYHDPTISAVLDKVIEELKIILKRDFNRRMIEMTAFKTFETWWDDQDEKFKTQQRAKEPAIERGPPALSRPRVEKIGSISTLLENKEGFGLDSIGAFGLGFRAAMPKMPSFRKIRKIKPPTPPHLDEEDSQGGVSDEDSKLSSTVSRSRARLSSDSESGEDENLESGPKTLKPRKSISKKPTWSSDESDSSEKSAESSDEDVQENEEEDSSANESSEDSPVSSCSSSESEEEEKEEKEEKNETLQRIHHNDLLSLIDGELESFKKSHSEPELVEHFRNLQSDFSECAQSILQDRIRTPEPLLRSCTPVPEVQSDVQDPWMDPETTLVEKDVTVSPSKDKTVESKKEDTPSEVVTLPKKSDSPKTKHKSSTKTENRKQSKITKDPYFSDTDTADEQSDLDAEKPGTEPVNVPSTKPVVVNGALHSDRDIIPEDSVKPSTKRQRSPIFDDHSYCLPWTPKTPNDKAAEVVDKVAEVGVSRRLDHDYTRPTTPPKPIVPSPAKVSKPVGKENRTSVSLNEIEAIYDRKKGLMAAKPARQTYTNKIFKKRNQMEEYNSLYSFLMKGIDQEDTEYLKRSYESMLADDRQSYWLNDTHWVDHFPTVTPALSPKKRKKLLDELPLHKTGCARSEGIYKVDSKQKQRHKFTFHEEIKLKNEESAGQPQQQSLAVLESSKAKLTQMSVSREVRSFQRRLLAAFGNETDSDLLKFNQLKFRKKLLKFGKSRIHDWGLFALEAIAADEMVIEYVGQSVRPVIADLREEAYEKMGIGSSYLFRIDMDNIIDATKCGNLARFINHSCNPNCYAKIITVENLKKIVIYSKQPIRCGEEITYDYKFPIEEQKISCLCGAPQCKGTLN